jgi:hypothetical protein
MVEFHHSFTIHAEPPMDERKRVKARTTVYLDADLLRAVTVRAAEEGRHDCEIHEEALRAYPGGRGSRAGTA